MQVAVSLVIPILLKSEWPLQDHVFSLQSEDPDQYGTSKSDKLSVATSQLACGEALPVVNLLSYLLLLNFKQENHLQNLGDIRFVLFHALGSQQKLEQSVCTFPRVLV